MVTISRDRLLTAILMVYRKLKATNARLSAMESLAGVKTPAWRRTTPPIVPKKACIAVREYAYGKCMRTPLLYSVSPRLK